MGNTYSTFVIGIDARPSLPFLLAVPLKVAYILYSFSSSLVVKDTPGIKFLSSLFAVRNYKAKPSNVA